MVAAVFHRWSGSTLEPMTILDAGTRTEVARNHMTNPSFEVSTAGVTGGGSATLTRDTTWAKDGVASLRVGSAGATAASTAAYPFALSNAISRMGVIPGRTYTLTGWCRLTAAQTGTLDGSARRITIGVSRPGVSDNFTFAVSLAAPNGAGETALSVTFTLPTDATNCWVRLMNGEGTTAQGGSGGSVWWDKLCLSEGATAPFFDGDTPPEEPFDYEWTGTRHESQSIKRDMRGGPLTAVIV